MLEFFLDLIFPQACVTCDSIGGYVCPSCYKRMRFYDQALEIEITNPSLDRLLACTTYVGTGSELIQTFKYGSSFDLAQTIAQLMKWHIPKPLNIDYLVPVPLHKKRQNDRGFNQAELLTKRLSKYWGIPVLKPLVRTKATPPQAELKRDQRLVNLTDAFCIDTRMDKGNILSGKKFALIDDVATTGSTLNECAKTLKNQRAEKVIGIIFAHGE